MRNLQATEIIKNGQAERGSSIFRFRTEKAMVNEQESGKGNKKAWNGLVLL